MLQTPAAPSRTTTSENAKVADPESFSASDSLKLPGFLKGLGLDFAINPSKSPDDDVKISYPGALLHGSASDCFHPQIKEDGSNHFANYVILVMALKIVFADPNPKATAERELDNLE